MLCLVHFTSEDNVGAEAAWYMDICITLHSFAESQALETK